MFAAPAVLQKDGAKSAFLTGAVVVGLVLATGSASALDVTIQGVSSSNGEIQGFSTEVQFEPGEQFVPIQYINVTTANAHARFAPDGTRLSGSPHINLTQVDFDNTNFGTGYGYARQGNPPQPNKQFGYGYGYGNQTLSQLITYTFTVASGQIDGRQNNVVVKTVAKRDNETAVFTATHNIQAGGGGGEASAGGGGDADVGGGDIDILGISDTDDEPPQNETGQQEQQKDADGGDGQGQGPPADAGEESEEDEDEQEADGDGSQGPGGQDQDDGQGQDGGPNGQPGPTGLVPGGISGLILGLLQAVFAPLAGLLPF